MTCGTASDPVTQHSLLDGQYRADIVGNGTVAGNVRACHVTPPSLVVTTSDTTTVVPPKQEFSPPGTLPLLRHGEGFGIVVKSSAAQSDEVAQESLLGNPAAWGKVPFCQVAPSSFVDWTKYPTASG